MTAVVTNPEKAWITANRPALGVLPPLGWANALRSIIDRTIPESMQGHDTDLMTFACGE